MIWYLPPGAQPTRHKSQLSAIFSAQQTDQVMLKSGIHFACSYLYIHSVRILYKNYIHNVCDIYLLWIRVDVNVYAMHTKYTPHFDKLSYTFCIQNSAAIFLLILYTKFIQKFVETRNTFCIHSVQISCIHLVKFLSAK